MPNTYHGEYLSSTTGQTGCVKAFASVGNNALNFPPQVQYHCDLCDKKHGFRLVRTHMTATPGQKRNFSSYCSTHNIEQDVEVPRK